MGPRSLQFAKAGAFDAAAWTAAEQAADTQSSNQALAAIATHADAYETLLSDVSDADLRADLVGAGLRDHARGVHGELHALWFGFYRMQLFLYLKASGREDVTSWNLRAGIDAPAATAQA